MTRLGKRKSCKRAVHWVKRRKGKHGEAARIETNMIDNLPENFLLHEVFSRLRNPKDVIVCRSVSKRWNSMLSYFRKKPSLALILNTEPQCATNDQCLDGWKGFDLNKYVDPEYDSPLTGVLASCKDVLLCIKAPHSPPDPHDPSQLYIVNPLTMQWTRVPYHTNAKFNVGLLRSGSKGKYYVVQLMFTAPTKLLLVVFDSKLGDWAMVTVRYPRWSQKETGWCPTQYQALSFKGALHWLAEDGPVVAYNPDYKRRCLLIHRSQEMRHASYGDGALVSETLTISMGHLRIIQLVCYPFPADNHHLTLWTLVDYKHSIWKQEHHRTYFRDMVSHLPWLQNYMHGYVPSTSTKHSMSQLMLCLMRSDRLYDERPETRERIIGLESLACHPTNPFLIYLCLPECIVTLDLPTKRLLLVSKVSKSAMGSYWNQYDKVVPLTLHQNPTPIPHPGKVLLPRPREKSWM